MDVHKPKAVHGWRELLNEVGVIVLGVAIALAGEQAVEWLHWRHEVAETRQALAREIAYNLGAVRHRLDGAPCLDRRLAELRTYFARRAADPSLRPPVPIGQPQFWRPHGNVWAVATAGQAVSHMPLEERIRYARLYDGFDWLRDRQFEESVEWSRLAELDDFDSLEREDWAQLREARARAKSLADKIDFSAPSIMTGGREVYAGPLGKGARLSPDAVALCRPFS